MSEPNGESRIAPELFFSRLPAIGFLNTRACRDPLASQSARLAKNPNAPAVKREAEEDRC